MQAFPGFMFEFAAVQAASLQVEVGLSAFHLTEPLYPSKHLQSGPDFLLVFVSVQAALTHDPEETPSFQVTLPLYPGLHAHLKPGSLLEFAIVHAAGLKTLKSFVISPLTPPPPPPPASSLDSLSLRSPMPAKLIFVAATLPRLVLAAVTVSVPGAVRLSEMSFFFPATKNMVVKVGASIQRKKPLPGVGSHRESAIATDQT